jgi:hypothetical protein
MRGEILSMGELSSLDIYLHHIGSGIHSKGFNNTI